MDSRGTQGFKLVTMPTAEITSASPVRKLPIVTRNARRKYNQAPIPVESGGTYARSQLWHDQLQEQIPYDAI